MKRTLTLTGQIIDPKALVVALLVRHNRRVADERIVNARVWNQIGLELCQVDIQSAVKPQAGCDGAHDLSDEAIEMLVVGTRNVKISTANVVHSLIVDEESAVRVLDGAVGGEDCVVGLNDRRRDLRGRVHGELKL